MASSGASCDGVAATCTMIPPDVKRAQMLLAYQLVVSLDAITGQPGGGGGAVGPMSASSSWAI